MVKVFVAHYNENLDWMKLIKYETVVISKNGIPQDTSINKGNEASSYLQYIIDNYDNLDDYTIFVHGHRTSWHHKSNIDHKINDLVFIHDYYNINEHNLDKLDHVFHDNPNVHIDLYNAWEDFINKTGIYIDYKNLKCRQAAQFYVSKNLILKNSKEKYIKMLDWLMTTKYISFWSSRVFEHSWHYIFTSNLEDIL